MKRLLITLAILLVLSVIYVYYINNVSVPLAKKTSMYPRTETASTVGVTSEAEVDATHNKFYGKIYETTSTYAYSSTLYLFNFIKIPIKINEKSFISYHLIFLLALLAISLVAWVIK